MRCFQPECGPTRFRWELWVPTFGLIVIGCTGDLGPVASSVLPPGSEALARNYIAALRKGDTAAAGNALVREARSPDTPAALAAIAQQLSGQAAESLQLVGFQVSSSVAGNGGSRHRVSISYQVALLDSAHEGTRYELARVSEEEDSIGQLWVVGIRTGNLTGPLQRINAFALSGKSPAHYMMLVLAMLVLLFILGVEIVCLRTPIRRRGVWILLILLGSPVLSFNWTTGEVHMNTLNVLLLGAGWLRGSAYEPVILEVAVPMGAVIFLARRYQLVLRARHTSKEGYTRLNLPGAS